MLKKNDFIEIEYTGIIKETSQIFETTNEAIAEENKIRDPNKIYKPKIICIGQEQILPSLEKELENKEIDKEYSIELSPEKAFGKKNPKLLQLLSSSQFKKENITPYPGLHVNIDNTMGIVRTVSPGRVIVDFNHPLSGKNIIYKIKILRIVTDNKEKITSILHSYHIHNPKIEIKESELIIKSKINENLKKELENRLLKLVPIIEKINFLKE